MLANTINRKGVAKLLGVDITWLSNIANHSNVTMPDPITSYKRNMLFDREEIEEWVATDPLKNLRYTMPPKPKPVLTVLPFMFGFEGAKQRVKRYHEIRAKRSKKNVVSLVWDEDFSVN